MKEKEEKEEEEAKEKNDPQPGGEEKRSFDKGRLKLRQAPT